MYNYFIYIWEIIRKWLSHVQVKTWKLIGALVALIALIYFFICIHQINRIGVEYHVMEVRGLSAKGSSTDLNIRINNGLLFEHNNIKTNWLYTTRYFDPKLERLGELNKLWTGEIKDSTYNFIAIDSLLNIYGLDSINDNNKHIYRTDAKYRFHSRNPWLTSRFNGNLFNEGDIGNRVIDHHVITSSNGHILSYEYIINHITYSIDTGFSADIDHPYHDGTNLFSSTFNSFPKITTPWDISQKSYKINYYSDGYDISFRKLRDKEVISKQHIHRYHNGNISSIYSTDCETIQDSLIQYLYVPKVTKNNNNVFQPTTPLKELKVDFGGPTEFLAMYPEPDVMTVSGFMFTDSLKLQQIMSDGIEFHAKFPQTESLQNARMFVVTTLISILISVVFTLSYQIIKAKYDKWQLNNHKKK